MLLCKRPTLSDALRRTVGSSGSAATTFSGLQGMIFTVHVHRAGYSYFPLESVMARDYNVK
jgi:hypothetical protein